MSFKSLIAGGAIVAAVAKMGKAFHASALGVDDLADNAAKLDLSAQALAAMQFAAERFNVSATTLTGSVSKMTVNIEKAASGAGDAYDALTLMGLSVKELKGLKPEQQFQKIAAALAKIPDFGKRAKATQDIFGKGGKELLGAISSGQLPGVIQRGLNFNSALGNQSLIEGADQYANSIQDLSEAFTNMVRAAAEASGWLRGMNRIMKDFTSIISPLQGPQVTDAVLKFQALTQQHKTAKEFFEKSKKAVEVLQRNPGYATMYEDGDGGPMTLEKAMKIQESWKREMDKSAELMNSFRKQMKSQAERDFLRDQGLKSEAAAGIKPGGLIGFSESPIGNLRGSAGAAAAMADFTNNAANNPMLIEQKKANAHLMRIERNTKQQVPLQVID